MSNLESRLGVGRLKPVRFQQSYVRTPYMAMTCCTVL